MSEPRLPRSRSTPDEDALLRHRSDDPAGSSLLSFLQLTATRRTGWTSRLGPACPMDVHALVGRSDVIYTIFEGTSEIQRLVVARSISGLQIP
jgi:hypothetical protein